MLADDVIRGSGWRAMWEAMECAGYKLCMKGEVKWGRDSVCQKERKTTVRRRC